MKSYKMKNGEYIDDKSIIHSKNNNRQSIYEIIEDLKDYEEKTYNISNVYTGTTGTLYLLKNKITKQVYFKIVGSCTGINAHGANGQFNLGSEYKPAFTDNSYIEFPMCIGASFGGIAQLRTDGGIRIYPGQTGNYSCQGSFIMT